MPEDTPTSEQEQQIAFLRKRWRRYVFPRLVTYFSLITWLSAAISKKNVMLGSFIGYGAWTLGVYIFAHWISRRFVHRLRSQEREFIIQASSDKGKRIFAEGLLQACKAVSPQKEYLRALQPRDDTLLRAAAYTTDTPQDQLLCPTDKGE